MPTLAPTVRRSAESGSRVAIATLERPLVSCIFSGKRLLCASCPTDELLSAAGCLVPPQLPSSTAHAHMPHTMLHPMRPSSMPPPSGGSRTSLRAAPLELPHVNSIAASLRHTAPLPERDVHSTGLDAAAMHAGPSVVLPRQHSLPERLPKARSTLLEPLRHLLRSRIGRGSFSFVVETPGDTDQGIGRCATERYTGVGRKVPRVVVLKR